MQTEPVLRVLGARLARRYRNDPVAFAVEVLGVTAWPRFVEMLRAVRDHDSVAIRAGQKVSKTLALACIILWWACTRRRSKVIFCAPSGIQAQDGLYAEIVRLHASGKTLEERKRDGGALFELGGQALNSCEDGIRWDDGRAIIGFSAADTKKTEKYLGHSSPELLIIADEASGIDEKILEALNGNRAGGGKMILAGNPTRNVGFFFDAFHGKAVFWHGIHISSEESPNVTGRGPQIPGLARREYIEQREREWGRASWQFQVKIEGKFAAQDERAFIGLELVLAAQRRWMPQPSAQDLAHPLHVGVDPAHQGKDQSAIAFRRGTWADQVMARSKFDNVEIAGIVFAEVERRARPGEHVRVKVDRSNNNGVADILKRATPKNGVVIEVVEVMSQEASTDAGFRDRRAQIYGVFKAWLETAAIPASSDLQSQILAPTCGFDERLRLWLESKRDLMQRLGRSPDHADALALSVFDPPFVPYRRPTIVNLSSR